MKILMGFAVSAVVCAVVAMVASPASASTIHITGDVGNSTEGLGNFSGSVTYNFDAGLNAGVLVIELTNTTDAATGGFITAFLFNINSSDGSANADLVGTTNPNFTEITDGNGNPFGTFDSGAGLGGEFQGGPNPAGGIAVGASATFTFHIFASDASTLTAMSFLTGHNEFNFVVRFRGMANDGSDKTPVQIIPLPAAAWLGLAGLGLVAVARRRVLNSRA